MIHLELNDLLKKVDCRYTLIVETAKRARQIIDGAQPLTEKVDPNPVSQAVSEVLSDKVTYIRVTDGIK
ncbi:MAG: DNA-directed RNA polymerase subunit omega [Christensenella sp.]|uniref:DNA-directed RNA polymerase subunit omega n=1 Tax=Christensenella sp. TaxID=1935934 RepID=UPI002B1EDCFC|nr:DNA-directed RNA polymerase subunit omega [Christensenella sp.]MEA5002449.1 DNA-directed RNA polymerase subunit omega [Christensenella sp.]